MSNQSKLVVPEKVVQEQPQIINLIDFYDYFLAASRTLKKKATVGDDVGHFGIGVLTEWFELNNAIINNDKVNISEECADACWYLANHIGTFFPKGHQIWNQLTEIFWKPQYSIILTVEEFKYLTQKVGDYGDICKKHFAYERQVDGYKNILKDMVLNLCKSYVTIMLNEKINPVQALNNNIQKLYDRYRGKFDSYFAMHRDLEKERNSLAKGL